MKNTGSPKPIHKSDKSFKYSFKSSESRLFIDVLIIVVSAWVGFYYPVAFLGAVFGVIGIIRWTPRAYRVSVDNSGITADFRILVDGRLLRARGHLDFKDIRPIEATEHDGIITFRTSLRPGHSHELHAPFSGKLLLHSDFILFRALADDRIYPCFDKANREIEASLSPEDSLPGDPQNNDPVFSKRNPAFDVTDANPYSILSSTMPTWPFLVIIVYGFLGIINELVNPSNSDFAVAKLVFLLVAAILLPLVAIRAIKAHPRTILTPFTLSSRFHYDPADPRKTTRGTVMLDSLTPLKLHTDSKGNKFYTAKIRPGHRVVLTTQNGPELIHEISIAAFRFSPSCSPAQINARILNSPSSTPR